MVISDEEARELIENLIIKYVPASMDKTNVMEKLQGLDKISLVPLADKCPKCKGDMVCVECGDFDITADVTVQINGRVIYDN